MQGASRTRARNNNTAIDPAPEAKTLKQQQLRGVSPKAIGKKPQRARSSPYPIPSRASSTSPPAHAPSSILSPDSRTISKGSPGPFEHPDSSCDKSDNSAGLTRAAIETRAIINSDATPANLAILPLAFRPQLLKRSWSQLSSFSNTSSLPSLQYPSDDELEDREAFIGTINTVTLATTAKKLQDDNESDESKEDDSEGEKEGDPVGIELHQESRTSPTPVSPAHTTPPPPAARPPTPTRTFIQVSVKTNVKGKRRPTITLIKRKVVSRPASPPQLASSSSPSPPLHNIVIETTTTTALNMTTGANTTLQSAAGIDPKAATSAISSAASTVVPALAAASSDSLSSSTASDRRSGLKRKSMHDETEDANSNYGYPANLTSIYPPTKRSRTPSSDTSEEPSSSGVKDDSAMSNSNPLVSSSKSRTATPPVLSSSQEKSEESAAATGSIQAPSTPPKPSSAFETRKANESVSAVFGSTSVIGASSAPPHTPAPRGFAAFASASPFPNTNASPSSRFASSSNATSAFGSSSAFVNSPFATAAAVNKGGFAAWAAPMASSGRGITSWSAAITNGSDDTESGSGESDEERETKKRKSKKSSKKENEKKAEGKRVKRKTSPCEDDEEDEETLGRLSSKKKRNERKHAIDEIVAVEGVLPSDYKRTTGEENEDVELELKNVKLFVNKGNRGFANGMPGYVKLLSHKETLKERLLFRREPLWKVSMNVRFGPHVRCTYDEDESVIRVVLKEAVEKPGVPQAEWPTEIVVYALKPGRGCSKQNFNDFAESLLESSQLKGGSSAEAITIGSAEADDADVKSNKPSLMKIPTIASITAGDDESAEASS